MGTLIENIKKTKIVQFLKYTCFNLLFNFRCNLRKIGFSDGRFLELKSLKGRYQGKRCFIVCTGPSLTKEDLQLIKDEYTFGMNSICKYIELEGWVPTFYGIQDNKVFESLGESVEASSKCQMRFVCNKIYKRKKLDKSWIRFPLNTSYNAYNSSVHKKYQVKFSDDCYSVVYNGYSITYSLIQIAVYMGFSKIFILGADNSYNPNGKHHFVETGHVSKDAYNYTSKFNAGYESAKKYIEGKNISIVNVTRGGALEVFQRANLEDILNEK